MHEQKILAAGIQSREAFQRIENFVKDGDFTEEAAIIWKGLVEYYGRDAHCTSCDAGTLSGQVTRSLSSVKHKEHFTQLIQGLGEVNVSPENIVNDFLGVKRESAGAKLATAILSGKATNEVRPLVDEYDQWLSADAFAAEEESEVIRGLPITELKETYADNEIIRVWPGSLNSRLDGGLIRGHHVVVFARPEMGKTLFVINATAGFLAQGLTVLYVGNEDPIRDIALRTICRLTKKSKYDVLDDPETAYAEALDKGYENLILAPLAPGTPKEVETLVQEYAPDVLIIDQLRNISMKEDNRVVQLEKAATAARNIGKKHNVLVLSVTQAGDSASGKAVLDMGDVDSSNTGIPAQADVMVGIGATTEDHTIGRRVLSLPKNKRSGRHDHFAVKVDPTTSHMFGVD